MSERASSIGRITIPSAGNWAVDVRAVGRGEPALKYLAAYVYRTAFSAERILHDDGRSESAIDLTATRIKLSARELHPIPAGSSAAISHSGHSHSRERLG